MREIRTYGLMRGCWPARPYDGLGSTPPRPQRRWASNRDANASCSGRWLIVPHTDEIPRERNGPGGVATSALANERLRTTVGLRSSPDAPKPSGKLGGGRQRLGPPHVVHLKCLAPFHHSERV
jgi:hypothetical protein